MKLSIYSRAAVFTLLLVGGWEISSIRTIHQLNQITFQKQEEKWTIGGDPVDVNTANEALPSVISPTNGRGAFAATFVN